MRGGRARAAPGRLNSTVSPGVPRRRLRTCRRDGSSSAAPRCIPRDRESSRPGIIPAVADAPKMVFLGFGKYVRGDRIYALEPIRDARRGGGSRPLVWVEGIAEPIVASRTERTIMADMGLKGEARAALLDD